MHGSRVKVPSEHEQEPKEGSKTPIQPSPKTAFSECNKKINGSEISFKTKNKMISLIENNLNDYAQDTGRNKNYCNLYQMMIFLLFYHHL
jgi:hypothetical protein